jgi:hypothetical protein
MAVTRFTEQLRACESDINLGYNSIASARMSAASNQQG